MCPPSRDGSEAGQPASDAWLAHRCAGMHRHRRMLHKSAALRRTVKNLCRAGGVRRVYETPFNNGDVDHGGRPPPYPNFLGREKAERKYSKPLKSKKQEKGKKVKEEWTASYSSSRRTEEG